MCLARSVSIGALVARAGKKHIIRGMGRAVIRNQSNVGVQKEKGRELKGVLHPLEGVGNMKWEDSPMGALALALVVVKVEGLCRRQSLLLPG
jgi:hypothetical protein